MNKIRRANQRNFFIAQNMIFDLDISEHAKVTYLYLCRCADDESQAFPSYNTIATKCSFSRSTAINTIKKLEEIGLLSVEKRLSKKSGKLVNTSNLYTLYDSPSHHPSVGDTPPLVQEIHHPSVGDTPPLVQEIHHPSVGDTPYKYPSNNTKVINTQSINQKESKEIDRIDESKNEKTPFPGQEEKASMGNTNNYSNYKSIIAENIEYDYLKEQYPHESYVDDILELMTEVMLSTKKTERINSEDKPIDLVKSRFMKLKSPHIDYVLISLKNNTTKANNIRAYLLTTLYNAPSTMESYYSNWVNHDMAHNWGK